MKKFFPLGTVIGLSGDPQRYMIFGRAQKSLTSGEYYDYLVCKYPSGYSGDGSGFLVDHAKIDRVFYVGFQDVEELHYSKALSLYLEQNGGKY